MSAELSWFKSSYSDSEGSACVEVATCPDTIHVRDSKHATGPQLTFSVPAWTGFVALVADR
ncbi:hypothetical protein SSP35_03_02250 [Streptomyces sp. NBRC 110611]|uniref:DUF397 domain-containing protein n=1 Tax=Streptomyces sp. NBRC 110611 TaxID=1621259 RepID=UPI0008359F0C|nr:DUF397 domain-containing protein [Streptomyces sp. NBRC 110611]GAU66577.1 hypothetical protein SSP35_03_02250 [Streptomyces sp. NBRC 110611]